MAEVDVLKAIAQAYPDITMEDASARLSEHHPVWLLKLDGLLIAANMLALWLWGARIRLPNELDTADLLGINAFDIFTRNLYRIPIRHNADSFLLRKSQVEKRVSGGQSSFAKAMTSRPDLREIYEKADPSELSNVWQYTLIINHPERDRPPDHLLQLQTTVHTVYESEEPVGYLAVYQPWRSPITSAVLKHEFKRLFARSGRIPYVQYATRGTELAIRDPDRGIDSAPVATPRGLALGSLEEWNRSLAEVDAVLDDQAKLDHPIVSFEDVRQNHPHQWIAMTPVELGRHGELLKGRSFATASTKQLLHKEIRKLKKCYPTVVLLGYFTGELSEVV